MSQTIFFCFVFFYTHNTLDHLYRVKGFEVNISLKKILDPLLLFISLCCVDDRREISEALTAH